MNLATMTTAPQTITLPMVSRGPANAFCRVADETVAQELAQHLFDDCYRPSKWFLMHGNTCGLARIRITETDLGWELRWPGFVTDPTHAHYVRQEIARWAEARGLAHVTVTLRTAKPE